MVCSGVPLGEHDEVRAGSRDWDNAIRKEDPQSREIGDEHDKLNGRFVRAGRLTPNMEPTGEATGEDVTDLIKDQARRLGFLEVGLTTYDPRYEFKHKRGGTQYPTAICLAYEQDYEATQTVPSIGAEIVHNSPYRTQAAAA